MKNYFTRKNKAEDETCVELLSQCEMFQKVPRNMLFDIAHKMQYRIFPKNQVLLRQSAPSDRFYLLESGEIRRTYKDPEDGKIHNVEYQIKAKSINSMKVFSGDPVYATVKCVSNECRMFEMHRNDLLNIFNSRPEIAIKITEGLCEEIRAGSRKYTTPLFEQTQQEVNLPAVAIAAGMESYYRSALNSLLNARLTGVQAELFPNMHIQVPTRIAYISGFKGLRTFFDTHVEPDLYENPTAVRLATAVSPGIAMTPISSLLEASNAGHMNPESMAKRWIRGIVPRAGREVIFGIGLNQMSDYFEERLTPLVNENFFPSAKNNANEADRIGHSNFLSNAAGSLMAGIVSGYLSHVPHNMSTFKLMQPEKSYAQLFRTFVDRSVPYFVDDFTRAWPSTARSMTRSVFATLFPRGVVIRTVQIVGSFMILNGTINQLQMREHHKIQSALGLNMKF